MKFVKVRQVRSDVIAHHCLHGSAKASCYRPRPIQRESLKNAPLVAPKPRDRERTNLAPVVSCPIGVQISKIGEDRLRGV
jgi:hypothetical protein